MAASEIDIVVGAPLTDQSFELVPFEGREIRIETSVASDNTLQFVAMGYDTREFIDGWQEVGVILHVAQNSSGQRAAVPAAVAVSESYVLSQSACASSSSRASAGPRQWAAFVR